MSLRFSQDFSLGLYIFLLAIVGQITEVDSQNSLCSKLVSFNQNYKQSFQVSYRYRSTYKCGFWNFKRCTRYRTAYRVGYRIATRKAYTKQYQCCKGWSQVGSQCTKAICTQPCVNGTCTKPDYCSCNPGYYGNQCERDCPSHKWGPHCRHDCLCQNNAKCSPNTGTCTCTPGWEGQYCNKTCDQGYYGNKCQKNCTCLNGASCDPVSGNCTCAAGYQGQRCERLCQDGTYGQNCQGICACQNNATCSPIGGFCSCPSGFNGEYCECLSGFHGCRKCNCSQWSICEPFTGKCLCQPGYIGKACDTQCPYGKYGPGCRGVCKCHNNATCRKTDGSCDCLPGWTGVECNNPCPAGYYGKGCQSKCFCKNNATCDHVTGNCTCVGAWQEKLCDIQRKYNYEKQTDHLNPLIPSTASGIVIVVIVLVAIAYVFYRRRKKPHMRRSTNADEPIYATPDVPRTDSGYEEATESTEMTTESNHDGKTIKQHIYQSPTPRTLAPVNVNDVTFVAMDTHYTELNNQGKSEGSRNYQSLSSETQKKNMLKTVTYDVPVKSKKPHVYEDLKFNRDGGASGGQSHYYKGLERPSTRGMNDISSVAVETENAEKRQNSKLENDYDTPSICDR